MAAPMTGLINRETGKEDPGFTDPWAPKPVAGWNEGGVPVMAKSEPAPSPSPTKLKPDFIDPWAKPTGIVDAAQENTMADFNNVMPSIIKKEVGNLDPYSDHKADKGGPTKYGISMRFLKRLRKRDNSNAGDVDNDGDLDRDDMKALTIEDAQRFYKEEWWDRYKYGSIKDNGVAEKVMGMAINMPAKTAHRIVQRALNDVAGGKLVVDGLIGKNTMKAINEADSVALLESIRDKQAAYYESLVARDETQRVWLKGWLNRARM